MSRTFAIPFLIVCAALGYTPQVRADWIELMPLVSNYHNLVGTAEPVTGGGPLLSISGEIFSTTDFDVYRIFIAAPAVFSASTVGTPGTLSDTTLFLFSATGVGISMNDDFVGSVRSTLPAGDPLYTSLAAGEYLLAIAGFDHDPIDSASLPIFPDTPFAGVNAPLPGRGPLAGQDSETSSSGTYRIDLTGAALVNTDAVAVPEPASFVLFAVAAAGAFEYRRRRNRLG